MCFASGCNSQLLNSVKLCTLVFLKLLRLSADKFVALLLIMIVLIVTNDIIFMFSSILECDGSIMNCLYYIVLNSSIQ